MRYARNFHPEWGYLAPAPSFLRTARIVIVATAVGATTGAGVVFALVDRPAAESSIAAPISAGAPAQLAAQAGQIGYQPAKPVAAVGQDRAAALAEAPAATDAPEQIRDQAAAATDAPPAQKKATKKRRSTSPVASRAEQANGGERVPFLLHGLFNLAPNNGRSAHDGYARAGGWDGR